MDREQAYILQNYMMAMRIRLRELDDLKNSASTESVLNVLKQLEGLAKNAREKIGNLELQIKMEI